MIIDMRCRPPFGGFLDPLLCDLYIADNVQGFSSRFGMTAGKAVGERTMETFIREMDEAGVDKAVVPIRYAPGGLATDSNAELHMDNGDLLRLDEQYGDRIIGVAGMNLADPEAAIRDIDRYVLNGPAKGVIVEPGFATPPMFADDERIYPIYEKCERDNVPVLISFGGMTAPNFEFSNPAFIMHVAETFPKLKMSLGHAAWPWVNEVCHVAFKYENVYLSPDIYLMNMPGSADYIAAADYWIPDKILYGSAYPVVNLKDAVALHRHVLNPAHIDDILGGNAARFFGMDVE